MSQRTITPLHDTSISLVKEALKRSDGVGKIFDFSYEACQDNCHARNKENHKILHIIIDIPSSMDSYPCTIKVGNIHDCINNRGTYMMHNQQKTYMTYMTYMMINLTWNRKHTSLYKYNIHDGQFTMIVHWRLYDWTLIYEICMPVP